MEKNMPKYFTYRFANEQIMDAIEAGFYLEAITIEESIIVDRLFRFCKDNGLTRSASQVTLGTVETFLKRLPDHIQQAEKIDFLDELNNFRENRNICLHQIAKSEPGEATIAFEDFQILARETALEGKDLTKKVGNWSKWYKRKSSKNIVLPTNN